ncbi:TolC family protein [Flavobacterium franklandianum]|uniref:TolC family protein n=1 Tax=Flavobacterium franklandianum TaxID=2594430 RepID=A0A553CJ34_9FLAO|nr:TolC family protein [Flavobacterium franklandianum]TRX20499.1 TolC family protein [Flavobacterium franklandianum]TRX21908.1 TolC family protein [Flavobacterium franklandianum]
MKNNIILFLVTMSLSLGYSQSTIDITLIEISKNNKTILANTQYWNAQKVQYKTGNSLYNPTVEYDYLNGSPANAGNQTDFTITQSFDFPSVYGKKNALAYQLGIQADLYLRAANQELLLEAKKICIELVYRNKLQIPLTKRKEATEKWLTYFKKKLETGDGTILDVNKAEIQLLEIKKQFFENASFIAKLNEQLTSLNGGTAITLNDVAYFDVSVIADFETLEKEIEAQDYIKKTLEQDKVIAQKQIDVSKALALPKMEVGYHYQGILGQTYNGIHTGISLPLWESKNRVKLEKAKMTFAETALTDHTNEHYFEIKQLYGRYESLKSILGDYEKINQSAAPIKLLDKALSAGQISVLEYFVELNYYNATFNSYLEIEKEYFEVVVTLMKYKL